MDSNNSPQQPDAMAASNAAYTSPNNKTSTTLLKDSTFLHIHDAFLLGWSLMELKSRIQTVACILSLNSEVVCDALKNPASNNSQVQGDQNSSDGSTQANSQPQPQGQDDQHIPPDSIDALLENVILKDVIDWKDVRGKTALSGKPIFQRKSLSSELQDNIWLTSVLRAIFSQIAVLHMRRFPDSDTTDTIYDLPSPPKHENDLKDYPYPYLYPLQDFNYPNVGVRKIKKEDIGNNNIDIDSFVEQFRLYDVTLRAVNCLTLLLTTPENSLMPETITDYQQEIVRQLLRPPSFSTESDSSDQNPAFLKAAIDSDTGQSSMDRTVQDNHRKLAIRKLSNLVIPLLEAWDGFLRESFYVNTNSLDDDTDSLHDEIELVAYEAGRSLAALSWGVSVALTPLENLENLDTLLKDEQAKEAGPYPLKDLLTKKVQNTWLNVFNDRDINHVQHQIAALSTALDEAYYHVHADAKPPKPGDPPGPPNPDLPGEAIQAIKHSLDYWERTIARMCSQEKPLIRPMPAKPQTQNGTLAKTQEQSGDIPESLTPLDWDLSKTLRAELIQQSTVWQSLILCQQSLQSFTVETVTQKILNDFMQDFEKAASQEIFNNGAFQSTLRIIGIIFGILVLLVLIALGVFLFVRPPNFNPLSIITSSPVIITAMVTAIGAIATPFVNGFLSKLSKIGSFFGSAGTVMEKALQDGYQQILVEFGYLNHSIGITFPLIEFFVWEKVKYKSGESPEVPIEDGYDFLVNVFWTVEDREEELQRVTRAAFGPIGTFVGASLKLGNNGSQQTPGSS